ncbi:MAG TPA: hypothetical protein VMM76_24180 [Pirellulaceae bacterium]|nr:hypothetical protein [Pirellulaceae bacterium]
MKRKVTIMLSLGTVMLAAAGTLCLRAYGQGGCTLDCERITSMSGISNGFAYCGDFSAGETGREVVTPGGTGGTVCTLDGQQTFNYIEGVCDDCERSPGQTRAFEGLGAGGGGQLQIGFGKYGCYVSGSGMGCM